MSTQFPDSGTLWAALSLAVRAPSVHNSQPWQWRVGPDSLHLWAVPDRHLPNTDPDRRDLMLSCGAALNHAVVALAALGWHARVHRFPDPAEPNHLAALELSHRPPAEMDVALAAAIPRRRTDRRTYSHWPVPIGDIALMGARAARAGVKLLRVDDTSGLREALWRAMRSHAESDAYLHELTTWSGRHAAMAGVPASNTPEPDPGAPLPSRWFAGTALAQPPDADPAEDNGVTLALGTRDDDDLARLRAGEATSLVLLTATALGLSSCPITEPLEIAETRASVRSDIFEDQEYPQMLLRVGWAPVNADPLPATPRWPLTAVVADLEGGPLALPDRQGAGH
ncbi:NAD(P)H nitroreductase [uncultured Mycolicibacterium sp.]|uniref:Acg family FMN-binding oxidoreductase n=1 Tax=uncultured Mycolicibacterium sp. TaxID=2320817 RepID=UPI0026241C6E|nr:NAD(P)H nitroreductase [uncultured Mycolicibacterium sp.]